MKFLIIAALVAVAAADYHDDVFHFSGLNGAVGLQRGAFLESSSPALLTKKYATFAPAVTKQYTTVQSSPVYSSFVSQPAYTQQYSTVKQVSAAPVLVKSIEQEIPVYSQQYVKEIAQPVYSQYTVKKVAQPAVYSQYTAQPAVYSQYTAQPAVYSQYTAQPAVFAQTKYASQPLVAQQYSSALTGVSTYASAYNGPQYRILSQVQEADPAGPYKVSYATENGIQASEEGALIPGAEGAVVAAQGSYSYTGPDGVVYTVNYIADENGFRASGDHLPQPPPIPAEILRSLEENARSGEQYDDQGRLISFGKKK